MGGVLLNMLTVGVGSALGLLLGQRLPARTQQSILTVLGLLTLVVGIQNATRSGNIIVPLVAIVLGVVLGEALRLDAALDRFATWLYRRMTGSDGTLEASADPAQAQRLAPKERFIAGFVTATLVFCIGPLTFVGSIQDGMGIAAGFQAIAIKSALDFFASMAFAASFGVGVLLSVLSVFVIQGGLALFGLVVLRLLADPAATAQLSTSPLIVELTAVGGLLLMALSLVLLDLQKPRVANFLPALLVAPLLVWGAGLLGINIYPF